VRRRDRLDLRGAPLAGRNLRGAWLAGATFDFADFSGADLTRAELNDSTGLWATFVTVTLVGAHMDSAFLARAVLRGANLSGARLVDAVLTGADLRNSRFVAATSPTLGCTERCWKALTSPTRKWTGPSSATSIRILRVRANELKETPAILSDPGTLAGWRNRTQNSLVAKSSRARISLL
jgi:uncharacterized protein YjbI with pentapeptide repeats